MKWILHVILIATLAAQCNSFLKANVRQPYQALHMASSDRPNAVQSFLVGLNNYQVSVGAGSAGYLILLMNRLLQSSDASLLSASSDIALRDDLLAIMACSALLLDALSEQEVQIKERDKVPLLGYALSSVEAISSLLRDDVQSLKWLLQSALTAVNPCISSVVIIDDNFRILAGGGVLSEKGLLGSNLQSNMPIFGQCMKLEEEVYLPDLQILPGKLEFSYFPINTQSLCIFPLPRNKSRSTRQALVIGTNQAKALRVKDLNKLRALCDIYCTT